MAEWLQIDSNLPTKPEVRRICRKSGAEAAVVIGRLVIFWSQVDQHGDLLDESDRPDGRLDLDGIVPDYEIDDLIDICGGDEEFWMIVCETGWLAIDPRGLLLPGFEKRFSTSAKNRGNAALRQQRHRMRDKGVIGTTPKPKKTCEKQASHGRVTSVTPSRDNAVTSVTHPRDESVTRVSKRVSESVSEKSKKVKNHENAPALPSRTGDKAFKNLPWQAVTDAKLEHAVKQRRPAIIETLYRESISAGWLQDSQHARRRFFSAVVYGVRNAKVKSARALLTYRVKENDWESGTDAADDEAVALMRIEDGIHDRPRVSNLEPPPTDFTRSRTDAIESLVSR